MNKPTIIRDASELMPLTECQISGHSMISAAWGQDYCENEGCGLVVGERDPKWKPSPSLIDDEPECPF